YNNHQTDGHTPEHIQRKESFRITHTAVLQLPIYSIYQIKPDRWPVQ
ncbi:MAG: hypothetical protein RLY89_2277, partial [Bacteroidota bacterium]